MVQPVPSAQGAIKFEYLAEVAVGTTARVDLCRATAPPHLAGRLLAVKRLHQHIAEDPSFANQFLDEVWMTASLKHPNVVEVAGWGNDEEGMYLAVELVQGVSLARLMKTIFDTGEAFTERMVVYIASRLCRGLAAAHSLRAQNGELLQLVHRDLTPSNVIVSFNGDLKIADFGLAKAKQRLTKTLTGLLKGQPQYMAPEQARGEAIDLRTDLFALGVLMFELFAGRKPWNVTSDFDAVQAILVRPPDDLRELRPKIDKELALVVQRCLEKDPAARYQTANDIQARLDEWLLVHGYQEGNEDALGRFVRRNAMRQMRWFERAIAGELTEGKPEPVRVLSFTGAGPPVSFKPGAVRDDDSDETDVTDVEQMLSQMEQRAADPATARRMIEDRDFSEEVPTIVQKSGSLPLRPKAGVPQAPAARLAPGARPPSKPPPRPPARPQPSAPAPGAPRPPGPSPRAPIGAGAGLRPAPAPIGARPTPAAGARPIASAAGSAGAGAAATAAATAAARAGASARPLVLPDARPMHDSINDDESDARTTSVKARSARPAARAPIIIAPRAPEPSYGDSESEEVPTLPLQGIPPSVLGPRGAPAAGSAASSSLPGQIAPRDPRVPPPPNAPQALPSLQSVEDDWPNARTMTEERLFAEADRLALEAVRLNDEAKVTAARAERHAVLAKIAGDAAAIAVEAVRVASTAGIADAARRLEDAYALEMTIRRLAGQPLDVPQSAGGAAPLSRATTTRMPNAPSSSPGMSAPRDREAPASYAPPPSMGASGPPSSGPPRSAMGGGTMPMLHHARPDSGSMAPTPPVLGSAGFETFEARLRPTIFGLPGVHVAALAIGTFVLVLILMWILMG